MRKLAVTAAAIVALAIPSAAVAATAAPAAPAAPGKNIVQTAVAAGSFTTLVKLVKRAGLAGALSGTTKLTVFAPTDAAFAKVPKATLAALGKDSAKLKAVLLYHVVPGAVSAAQATKLAAPTTAMKTGSVAVKTLQGSALTLRLSANGMLYVDKAMVVTADVKASNGVIHVIDQVILPAA